MSDFYAHIALGVAKALSVEGLFFCFVGVTVGTIVGVLPGIGPLAAISLALPMTYYLDPTAALIMLAGIFYGAQYGGSTASILLNLPGTATAAITCLDGYPLAKQGKAPLALFVTAVKAGIDGYAAFSWQGIFAPAGTPPEVLDTLYAEIAKALESDKLQTFFKEKGFLVESMPPAESKEFIANEVMKWKGVVEAAGIGPK